jgi:hypothetical protein
MHMTGVVNPVHLTILKAFARFQRGGFPWASAGLMAISASTTMPPRSAASMSHCMAACQCMACASIDHLQVDEGTNVGLELSDGGVNASLDLLSGELSEPAFDLIDP